jgi:cytoskeletal protein RodZ
MNSPYVGARIAAVVGGAALITMASFVASCSKDENKTPPPATTTTVSTTPSSSPSATPTEKVLSPTDGNKFSPNVVAPPAPTMPPGNHHHGLN